jgi:homoserine kinase
VYNLSRSALMAASLFSGNLENLRVAVQDRIHQPYRSSLIANYDDVSRMSYELGTLGTCISGAGPTIISMVEAGKAENFAEVARAHLKEKGLGDWQVKLLTTESSGAQIFIE